VPLPNRKATAQQLARLIGKEVAAASERCRFAYLHDTPKRLRIGYISSDFRAHAVGKLVHEMFDHHDHDAFEIFAYSLLPVFDAWMRILEQVTGSVLWFTEGAGTSGVNSNFIRMLDDHPTGFEPPKTTPGLHLRVSLDRRRNPPDSRQCRPRFPAHYLAARICDHHPEGPISDGGHGG